jgi:dihydroneopterin aldolase
MTQEANDVAADDAILIEGIEVPAALGITAEERALGRPVRIDLEVGYPLTASGQSDRVEDTIDYGELFRVVEDVVTGQEHHLVEALGTRIIEALFSRFEITWVKVHVRKPNPLDGVLDYTGIRMTRYRGT